MPAVKHAAFVCLLVMAGATRTLYGQQPPPVVYHPGDKIIIFVVFEGADAARLRTATAYFGIPSTEASQPGFQNEMVFAESRPGRPNTFILSFTVTSNIASGTYQLTEIRAVTSGEAPLQIIYGKSEIPELSVRIENPGHFVKPAIKSVKDVSNP